MLDAIIALANQSLLQIEDRDDGELRFSMLGTIREYALEKLTAAGLLEATRRRHAAYFAALAGEATSLLEGSDQQIWLERLQANYYNLRFALEWYADNDPVAGLRCAANLSRFWHVRGLLSEGRSWIDRLLAAAEASASDEKVVDRRRRPKRGRTRCILPDCWPTSRATTSRPNRRPAPAWRCTASSALRAAPSRRW